MIRKSLFAALLFGACLGVPCANVQAGRHHHAGPTKEIVLVVCHPCTDCKFEVPVCIPCCCEGAPSVCFERTLIGAGRSVYEWPCGHRVVVRYTRHGGYRVAQH